MEDQQQRNSQQKMLSDRISSLELENTRIRKEHRNVENNNSMYKSAAFNLSQTDNSAQQQILQLKKKCETLKKENMMIRKEMRATKSMTKSKYFETSQASIVADGEVNRLTKEVSRLTQFKKDVNSNFKVLASFRKGKSPIARIAAFRGRIGSYSNQEC